MAKRIFSFQSTTWTPSAAGSTASGSSNYMAIKGGTSTQLVDVLEIMLSGQASASIVGGHTLTRCPTLGVTPTALAYPASDGGANPSITALASPTVTYVVAATQTTTSNTATDAHLEFAMNLFGGIVRWNAAPTQQWQIVGNGTTSGESCFFNNSSTGGVAGAAYAHIIYEAT